MDFLFFIVCETMAIGVPYIVWVWDRMNRRENDLIREGKLVRRYSY